MTKSGSNPDQAIARVLSDPAIQEDKSAAVPLMELNALYKTQGPTAVVDYVQGSLSRARR